MKPSEYIKKYGKYKDAKSLRTLLEVWSNSTYRSLGGLWKELSDKDRGPKIKAFCYGVMTEKQYKAEIALAERTINKWNKQNKFKKLILTTITLVSLNRAAFFVESTY